MITFTKSGSLIKKQRELSWRVISEHQKRTWNAIRNIRMQKDMGFFHDIYHCNLITFNVKRILTTLSVGVEYLWAFVVTYLTAWTCGKLYRVFVN